MQFKHFMGKRNISHTRKNTAFLLPPAPSTSCLLPPASLKPMMRVKIPSNEETGAGPQRRKCAGPCPPTPYSKKLPRTKSHSLTGPLRNHWLRPSVG